MSDLYAYRASAELAAALRECRERDRAFRDDVVLPFDREHPGHEVMWSRSPFSNDWYAMGFYDGTADVPPGLSRAKSRKHLRPVRGAAGRPWRDVLARMERRPRVEPVYRRFGVRAGGEGGDSGRGGFFIAPTQFLDGGDDGVLVVCKYDLGRSRHGDGPGLSKHLTPIPLSEFYAIKERLESEKDAAAGRSA